MAFNMLHKNMREMTLTLLTEINARLRDEKLSAYEKVGNLMKNERDMKELIATADKKPSKRHEKLMFFSFGTSRYKQTLISFCGKNTIPWRSIWIISNAVPCAVFHRRNLHTRFTPQTAVLRMEFNIAQLCANEGKSKRKLQG